MKTNLALLLLRLVFGFRLLYGVFDNVISWARMREFSEFLAANGFPFPLVCAVVSVYAQLLAALCWIVGFQVRIASLVMIFNFIVALIGVHLLHGDTYLGMAPAIHVLTVALVLYLTGPGRYAVQASRPVEMETRI